MTQTHYLISKFLAYPIYISPMRTRVGFSFRLRIYRLLFTVKVGRLPWAKYQSRFWCRPSRIARGVRFSVRVRPFDGVVSLEWVTAPAKKWLRRYRCPFCHREAGRADFYERIPR